jgi:hypothetical protein
MRVQGGSDPIDECRHDADSKPCYNCLPWAICSGSHAVTCNATMTCMCHACTHNGSKRSATGTCSAVPQNTTGLQKLRKAPSLTVFPEDSATRQDAKASSLPIRRICRSRASTSRFTKNERAARLTAHVSRLSQRLTDYP